jgi:hypothetical protein
MSRQFCYLISKRGKIVGLWIIPAIFHLKWEKFWTLIDDGLGVDVPLGCAIFGSSIDEWIASGGQLTQQRLLSLIQSRGFLPWCRAEESRRIYP